MRRLLNFLSKNIDPKRLITYLLVYLIIWLVSLLWKHFDFDKLKSFLGPILSYSTSIPLIPTLIILFAAQYFIYKGALKFQLKFGRKRNIQIPKWVIATDRITPQWVTTKEIYLNNGLLSSVKCSVFVKTNYLRFGFKLLDKEAHVFGTHSILTSENNGLFHIGNGNGSNNLYVTSYKNGVQDGADILSGNFSSGDTIKLELKINESNTLEFIVNGQAHYHTVIKPECRERLILMAWGDGNEYEMTVTNIEVTIKK